MDLLKGYQPIKGELDSNNPPKGGSGVMDSVMNVKSIRKVNLKKDDKIVLTTDEPLSTAAIDGIKRQAEKVFPDNFVIILSGGLKLSVISKKK